MNNRIKKIYVLQTWVHKPKKEKEKNSENLANLRTWISDKNSLLRNQKKAPKQTSMYINTHTQKENEN